MPAAQPHTYNNARPTRRLRTSHTITQTFPRGAQTRQLDPGSESGPPPLAPSRPQLYSTFPPTQALNRPHTSYAPAAAGLGTLIMCVDATAGSDAAGSVVRPVGRFAPELPCNYRGCMKMATRTPSPSRIAKRVARLAQSLRH